MPFVSGSRVLPASLCSNLAADEGFGFGKDFGESVGKPVEMAAGRPAVCAETSLEDTLPTEQGIDHTIETSSKRGDRCLRMRRQVLAPVRILV